MGIAQLDAKRPSGIDARVHARHDEVLLGRRQGEVALVEAGGVLGRGGLDVALDGGHSGGGGEGSAVEGVVTAEEDGRGGEVVSEEGVLEDAGAGGQHRLLKASGGQGGCGFLDALPHGKGWSELVGPVFRLGLVFVCVGWDSCAAWLGGGGLAASGNKGDLLVMESSGRQAASYPELNHEGNTIPGKSRLERRVNVESGKQEENKPDSGTAVAARRGLTYRAAQLLNNKLPGRPICTT